MNKNISNKTLDPTDRRFRWRSRRREKRERERKFITTNDQPHCARESRFFEWQSTNAVRNKYSFPPFQVSLKSNRAKNRVDLSKKNLYRVIVQLKAQRVFRSEDPRKAKVTRARFLFQFGLRVKLYALQRNIRVTWIGY